MTTKRVVNKPYSLIAVCSGICMASQTAGPLTRLLCEKLSVEASQLMDYDLHLADTQPAVRHWR